jgi:hypothetical protein
VVGGVERAAGAGDEAVFAGVGFDGAGGFELEGRGAALTGLAGVLLMRDAGGVLAAG